MRVEKFIKTSADVIDVMHENTLYETAPEFSKVASVLAAIPATSCSAESSFSGLRRLKTSLRNIMEQHRLNSLAIICIERTYGNQVIVNRKDKMIDIFGQRYGSKTFFFQYVLDYIETADRIKYANLYTWVERGTVRVKCLAQEHNTMSPARARTRIAGSGVERTNHEATAPPTHVVLQWV